MGSLDRGGVRLCRHSGLRTGRPGACMRIQTHMKECPLAYPNLQNFVGTDSGMGESLNSTPQTRT